MTATEAAASKPMTRADVFATLGSATRWVGDGQLQVNRYELPSRDLSAARELSFVAVHASGNYLKVLLDAGTVLRRRASREVLYWRTSLGDSLVRSSPGA